MTFVRFFNPGYIVTYDNKQLGGYCQKVDAQENQDVQNFDIPYKEGKLQFATSNQERNVTLNFIIANATRTASITEYNRTAAICKIASQKTINSEASHLCINDSNRFIYATFKNIRKDEDANGTEGIFGYSTEFTSEDSCFFENTQRIEILSALSGSTTGYLDPYGNDIYNALPQLDLPLNNGEMSTYNISIQVKKKTIGTTYCKIYRYNRLNEVVNHIEFNDLRNLNVDEFQRCIVRPYDVYSNTTSNKTYSEFTYIGRYFFTLSPQSLDNKIVIQTDGTVDIQISWHRAYSMYE